MAKRIEKKRIKDSSGNLFDVELETNDDSMNVREISRKAVLDVESLKVRVHELITNYMAQVYESSTDTKIFKSEDMTNIIVNGLIETHSSIFKGEV